MNISTTPFEWAAQHVQVVGWGTVLLGVYKATRFLTKLGDRLSAYEKQATEAHKDTHALRIDTRKMVESAEQQARRWETFLVGKAMHGGHIAVEDVAVCETVSEEPEDL